MKVLAVATVAGMLHTLPASADFCYGTEDRLPLEPAVLGEGTRVLDTYPDELNYICSSCFSAVTSLRADIQIGLRPRDIPNASGPVAALTRQLNCLITIPDCTVTAVADDDVWGFYTEVAVVEVFRADFEVYSGRDFFSLSILGDESDRAQITALIKETFQEVVESLTSC